jgi:hypothetical protein
MRACGLARDECAQAGSGHDQTIHRQISHGVLKIAPAKPQLSRQITQRRQSRPDRQVSKVLDHGLSGNAAHARRLKAGNSHGCVSQMI